MRVLMVNENLGGHATVHHMLERVLDRDHPELDVEIVDVPRPGPLGWVASTRVPGLARLDLDLQSVRAQLALSRRARREVVARAGRFDVLHVYTGNAALRMTDVLRRVPSVVSTDATNATNAYRLPYRRPSRFTPGVVRVAQHYERPVYEAATLVVANTAWVADSLRGAYGVTESLRVLPFGVAAPEFGAGAAPGTRPDAEGELPRVVFVGRDLERKGALRLHRLHQSHLADLCELVIVSTDHVPAGRRVRVVDDVTVGSGRLWQELRAAAVFAFPSPIDQAPNAVIEGLAAGLPVVGLDIAAMPEMVPRSCGTLLAPEDDVALVAALRRLVTDPLLRQQQGAAARAHYLETYDARSTTRRWVTALHEARELHGRRLRDAS